MVAPIGRPIDLPHAACKGGLQADSFRCASHGRYQVPNESDLTGEDVAQDQKNAVESLV